jgi:SAM-dependent methyltransferase
MTRFAPSPLYPEAPAMDADLAVFQLTACTWCGSTDREAFPKEPIGWWLCRRCGLWNSMVTDSQDAEDEEYGYSWYEKELRRKQRTSEHRLRVIEAMAPAKGDLLDLGCSYGTILRAATRRGWRAHGVDISEDVVKQVQSEGFDARVASLTSVPYDDASMDVVHARHVLDHEVQTYRALGEMDRVAKPGGLIMVEVGDVTYKRYRPDYPQLAMTDRHWQPAHRVSFSPEVLLGFCTRMGWTYVPEPGWLFGSPHFMVWRWWKRLRETHHRTAYVVTFWRKPA